MADGISIKVDKSAYDEWERRVRKNIQYNVNGVLGEEGDAAARWIAMTYLHGKAMKKITGQTIGHFGVRWVKKYKGYFLRPGYGVPGSQNYLERYVGTSHEFVKPGFDAYMSRSGIKGKVEKAVRDTLEEAK